MDDIDAILNETTQNVLFKTLEGFSPNAEDVSMALNRLTKVVEHGKDMGIFTDEDHEANILAVGVIGMHLLKAYPELGELLKQHVRETLNPNG